MVTTIIKGQTASICVNQGREHNNFGCDDTLDDPNDSEALVSTNGAPVWRHLS